MSQYIFESGKNDGKVLTSTEWEQSGRIYLDGQYLAGYTYNRYCPYTSYSKRTRSVTGCTNTADAQILYYYLEQGVQLELSVDSSDYFSLSISSKRYYLSESSSIGEGTISVLNGILSDVENYASGDFIAALNFFCGVKNHSEYGSSTGTSVYPGTYWDGKYNLKAFRAAGFDSYFSISDTNSTFFTSERSGSSLTDTAYSIIRENLDYGEPVRVDIPSHSIYLDGYRWNQKTGEYEYHLNYGWGVGDSHNTWYTTDEITDISIDTLGIDLDPKIRVTVMNSSSEYYGGSFLRGVERINHIQNDTDTTFSFVKEISGELLYLDTIEFTSSVDIEFLNWNVCICTTSADAVTSERAMVFENQTGGIIVNGGKTSACLREEGNSAVKINLNGGYYYSGLTAKNFTVIKQWLQEFWDHKTTLSESTEAHQAVLCGDADDTINLTAESVIAGGLMFGAGENTLTIESGSAVYGNIQADADSLQVCFESGEIEERTMLYLSADSTNLFSATGGRLYFSLSEEITHAVYHLVEFQDAEEVDDFSLIVSSGQESFILDFENRTAGNLELLYLDNILALSVGEPTAVITVAASETGWTTKNITVSACFTLSGTEISGEYSFDAGTSWDAYSGPLLIEDNMDIWFRAVGFEDQTKSYSVTNIDRIAPTITEINVSYNAKKTKAFVSAEFDDDRCLKEHWYKISGESDWRIYTDEIEVHDNCTIFLKAVDGAGNVAETSVIISEIEECIDAKNDVDGNGLSDILMQQKKNTGQKSLAAGAWLTQAAADPVWNGYSSLIPFQSLFGSGNFMTEKNTADIYIYDKLSNSISVWITDNNGRVSSWENVGTFSSDTTVLALGKFNNGETTDLLLKNKNGAVGCYLTDGSTPGWHYFQSLGEEWSIVAVGDFNGDRLSDMVLLNDGGYAGCWLTQADGSVVWENLDSISEEFEIAGAGDFNGDGTDDVLLKKGNYYGAWIVKNGKAVSWFGLGTIADGVVEQIGDFNGDGVDDLRLRTSDNDLGAMLVSGEDDMKWKYFGSVGKEWSTVLASL